MASGKSLELEAIEKPEPEGLCVKCRIPWSTHMTKDKKRRKKYEGEEHQNSASTSVQGFTLRGTPMGFQGSPQESLGRPRPPKPRPTVSWVKRERAERQARELQAETATELIQNIKQGRKRG